MSRYHKYCIFRAVRVCTHVCVQAHPLVINSEVIVELDDTLGLPLELPVGLLSPPLFQVAMAVVLAP